MVSYTSVILRAAGEAGAPLELAFHTRDIRTTCESARRAKRVLGEDAALALRNRLADMRAARNTTELLAGMPTAVAPDRMRLKLSGEKVLEFVSNHRKTPLHSDNIDWAEVTRIRIVFVGAANG